MDLKSRPDAHETAIKVNEACANGDYDLAIAILEKFNESFNRCIAGNYSPANRSIERIKAHKEEHELRNYITAQEEQKGEKP